MILTSLVLTHLLLTAPPIFTSRPQLFVSAEGIDGPYAQGFFLQDKLRPRHLHDVIGARQAHLIAEALREPERLGETDPLLGSVEVGDLLEGETEDKDVVVQFGTWMPLFGIS